MPNAQVIDANIPTRGRKPRIDLKIASRVHEALNHAEFSLDQAFIATAELTTLLPAVRGQANLAFCVPQDAIAAGSETITTLTRARAELQRVHAELAELRDWLRVPATGVGVEYPKRDDNG